MSKFKNFNDLSNFILTTYNIKPEFPWKDYPKFAVFRHKDSKRRGKWFMLFMEISGKKLGLQSDEILSVINLKCDPELSLILQDKKNIFSAYHMNKKHWISVILNSISKSQICDLIEQSIELTKK